MSKPVRIFWKIFFLGFGAFVLLLLLINFGVFGKMPSIAQLENPTIVEASEVLAIDGTPMGKYYKEKGNRSVVAYKDISKHVVDALVATEDERFYDHSGIDGKSLMRAVLKLGRDGGGSTITQQLALNLFSTRASNVVMRIIQKLKEQIIAVKLERNFTKQEILALYLNTVSYSDNVFGIRNAARTFFQKEPDRLTVEEAAMLIGMVNAPSRYNPRVNPKPALDRRNLVIDRMATNGYITEPEASKFKVIPINLKYRRMDENSGLAPYFREVLRDELKKWCKEHTNPLTDEPYDLYEDGLKIYTTINPRMQLYAEEAMNKHMPTLQKALNAQANVKNGTVWKNYKNILDAAMKSSDRWKLGKEEGMSDDELRKMFNTKVPMRVFAWNSKREKDTIMTPLDSIKYHRQMLQLSFMVMDPITGEVKAWVGGIDFKTYKYDHVNLNTKRQVGSSIKPFLYCEAIEEAGFTPETPCEATQQYFPGFGYVPAKNNPKHTGTRSMASGLAWSVNEVAAYIMKQVGPKRFADFLKRINIQTKVEPYPSMALGAADLSMFEMMWGYTMFPNQGYSTKPIYITRIEDKNGNVLENFQTKMNQVISESSAYTMVKMLQGPVDIGTAAGLRARLGAAEMGGKTGTTNDNSDAWFFGFTPQLLAGTWIGCDDRFIRLESGLGYGGQASRPIWESFFQKVYADKTLGIEREAKFVQPAVMRNELLTDYSKLEQVAPPGAEGQDVGNGTANDYLGTPDSSNVPVESKLDNDEKKILQEATKSSTTPKKDGKDAIIIEQKPTKEEEKKKKGFFKRLFGKDKEKEKSN